MVCEHLDKASRARIAQVASLRPGAKIHVAGICGTGTSAVALLLKQKGFQVSGSDKAFYPPIGELVQSEIVDLYQGYADRNLTERPDLVVIGNSLSRGNPEVEYVLRENIPYASMPEVFRALLIGERFECPKSVVVSGTHGKSTTTAAIAVMLDKVGRSPGFFIGGIPKDLPVHVRPVAKEIPLEKRVVVLEGDEYDSAFFAKWAKFKSYRADIAVITGIEFDHADIYQSLDEIIAEFNVLAENLPKDGLLLCFDGSPSALALSERTKARFKTFGDSKESFAHVVKRSTLPKGGQRLVFDVNSRKLEFETSLCGLHNAWNLLAAATVGLELGLTSGEVEEGLSKFKGVLRRQQLLADNNGILLVEDFAHHPTEVKLTLQAFKELYPDKRLIAVFEPRSNTSRRSFFQQDYVDSLAVADLVIVKAVEDSGGYQKSDDAIVSLNTTKLVADISREGGNAFSFSETSEIFDFLRKEIHKDDLIVVMSNGSFDGLMEKLRSIILRDCRKTVP